MRISETTLVERISDRNVQGEYEEQSPCQLLDLPQNLAEPILVKYATQHGFQYRLNTQYLSSTQDQKSGLVTTIVMDGILDVKYKIRSKYVAGADGGRSEVARQIGLEITSAPSGGVAYNVLVEADLSHLMTHSMGMIHVLVQPEKEVVPWAVACYARCVKPWHEWIFAMIPMPGADRMVDNAAWKKRVKDFIGDSSVEVKVLGVSKWRVNESYATQYTRGNM